MLNKVSKYTDEHPDRVAKLGLQALVEANVPKLENWLSNLHLSHEQKAKVRSAIQSIISLEALNEHDPLS